jgi:RNA polymerase sigma-70 factor (ECF subfamily)
MTQTSSFPSSSVPDCSGDTTDRGDYQVQQDHFKDHLQTTPFAQPKGSSLVSPGEHESPVLTEFAFKLVRRKARQIVGKTGYTLNDVDDIQQDLILDLLEHLPQFNPDLASYETFVVRVVDRKVSNLLRHRQMEKRDCRREAGSIYDEICSDDNQVMRRIEAVSQDEQSRRMGKDTLPQHEQSELEIDMKMVLDEMTPDLRQVAELLQTMSPNQAAEHLNISRTTFYRNYLVPLREILQSGDMDEYLS